MPKVGAVQRWARQQRIWSDNSTTGDAAMINSWLLWNAGTTASGTSVNYQTQAGRAWEAWNEIQFVAGTTSANVVDTHAWSVWNRQAQAALNQVAMAAQAALGNMNATRAQERQQAQAAVLTPEQIAAESAALRKTRARERLAKIKAEQLLVEHLSNEQRRDLKQFGFFKLYVQKGEETRVYRIRRGRIQNVDLVRELPSGDLQPVKTLCLHPVELVPDQDTMLIQKLMLEANEDEFLRIANHMAPVPAALLARRAA